MSQLNLSGANRETVLQISKERSEPEWLRQFRLKSLDLYQSLPIEQSRLYTKYVDLGGVNLDEVDPLPKVRPSADEVSKIVETSRSQQHGFCLLQIDGETVRPELPKELAEAGVVFEDLSTAIQLDPEFFRSYYLEKAILPEEDKLAALNNALFTNGTFLHVPKGIEVKTPFRAVTVLNQGGIGLLSQTLVIGEPGSKFTFVEESYTTRFDADRQALFSTIGEVHLKANAEVQYGGLQNLGPNVVVFSNKRSVGGKDSIMTWAFGYFGSRVTRSRLDSVMKEQGAFATDFEVVFGAGAEKYDLTANLVHRAQDTSGQVRAKGVLRDKARAIMKGLIIIAKNAKNSNAYLAEHAMLLSPDAKADAMPGLEIENNAVKATHSASVSQINEEQIFYLKSRGLNDDQATKMIVTGFFEPLIKQLPVKEIKARIRMLIDMKWAGRDTSTIFERAPEEFEEPEAEEKAKRDIFEGHYKYR